MLGLSIKIRISNISRILNKENVWFAPGCLISGARDAMEMSLHFNAFLKPI